MDLPQAPGHGTVSTPERQRTLKLAPGISLNYVEIKARWNIGLFLYENVMFKERKGVLFTSADFVFVFSMKSMIKTFLYSHAD
ncbi:hypothetical protein RRG08_049453 [Elysia crispata]|uniref:Uncharacterized protein n=1 Tax=Elysia crispata TaxID=231223 RepID=A0AAE0ZSF1_9GAST|nr:hypothetical protein RRG08_049453 [Elysia crispata]